MLTAFASDRIVTICSRIDFGPTGLLISLYNIFRRATGKSQRRRGLTLSLHGSAAPCGPTTAATSVDNDGGKGLRPRRNSPDRIDIAWHRLAALAHPLLGFDGAVPPEEGAEGGLVVAEAQAVHRPEDVVSREGFTPLTIAFVAGLAREMKDEAGHGVLDVVFHSTVDLHVAGENLAHDFAD